MESVENPETEEGQGNANVVGPFVLVHTFVVTGLDGVISLTSTGNLGRSSSRSLRVTLVSL